MDLVSKIEETPQPFLPFHIFLFRRFCICFDGGQVQIRLRSPGRYPDCGKYLSDIGITPGRSHLICTAPPVEAYAEAAE